MQSQMSNTPNTDAICELIGCLDRSGSMEAIRVASEKSFNDFVVEQANQPGICYISLYEFDDKYEEVYVGKEIKSAPKYTLTPRGWTALYDAMGKTMRTALDRITDKTRKVIFLFVTDGGENYSKEYNAASVSALVAQVREKGWQVLFIGSDEASIKAAQAVNIPRAATLFSAANAQGTARSFTSTSHNIGLYRSGAAPDANYSIADQAAQDEARNNPTNP